MQSRIWNFTKKATSRIDPILLACTLLLSFISIITIVGAVDNFGHKYLSGSGKVLENAVRENLGVKARAVELNVFQRCAAHLQSKTDVEEALANGKAAFRAAMAIAACQWSGVAIITAWISGSAIRLSYES